MSVNIAGVENKVDSLENVEHLGGYLVYLPGDMSVRNQSNAHKLF
jgi:hypothetical protein